MPTKFFTNEEENTLLEKFKGVFKHTSVAFFDALVGYFRSSGYFALRPFLNDVPNIRILVGINVDAIISKYQSKGLLFQADAHASKEELLQKIIADIQTAAYDKKVENGIIQFIEDVLSGKLQIKAHPTRRLHAKIYIFRPEVFNEHSSGSVITGSSNLTDAGLGNCDERNYEFNVALRDYDDVCFATEEFEKLWKEGIPLLPFDIEEIKHNSFINDSFTPFEIYIKFLIEYFGKNVEFDPNSISDLPEGFLRLSYQVDAVTQGYELLKRHGGFFLSDVVGLGKTIVATLIAKKFFYFNHFPQHITTTLVICPPAMKPNWEKTMQQFGLKAVEFLNNGSLHKIEDLEKYDLIIVDEAHKFRTDTAFGYTELQKLCKAPSSRRLADGTKAPKKVILVSATPLNNRPGDIRNLVFLFKDGKDNTLEVSNLSGYFAGVMDEYKKIQKLPQKIMLKRVAVLYADVREKIIKPLTIRRTRRDLTESKDYKEDLDKQGIHFPIVEKPHIILYQLDKRTEQLYDDTIQLLIHPVNGLGYFRYRGLAFLTPELKQKYKTADLTSNQLSRIMKTLLLKRLDSSFYAFKATLKRFLNAAEAMMKMKENGRIIIAPNLNVNQYILDDNEELLFELVADLIDTDPTISIVKPEDFNPAYWTGMEKDVLILKELNDRWAIVASDPKLESFIVSLNDGLFDPKKNKEGKLVIFSESKETTDYLYERLLKSGFKKVISVDSSNRKKLMPVINENFDANYNLLKQKDDVSIIITTEVLAEGVNLHRSNSIVNYDTPWNSTRLMQRIGRVNRIGSTASRVYVYNFYPTTQVESDIELKKKAILKLQSFHSALGEDSQIYSEEEEVETFGIFEKIQQEDRDERLAYLMELRQFKKNNPEEFRRIKNMPLRARTGRKDPIKNFGTLGYIKNRKRDAFYFLDKDNRITELTFPEAATQFKADNKELPLPIHDRHHEQINIAVKDFYDKMQTDAAIKHISDGKQSPREKSVLSFLSAVEKLSFLNKEEIRVIALAKAAIKKGRFADLQRQLFALNKELKIKIKPPVELADQVLNIIDQFPVQQQDDENAVPVTIFDFEKFKPQIIISESFIH